MGADDTLLEARFFLNMKRVGALINLVTKASAGEAVALETGARDDISRAVVVFLHATFEDLLPTAARRRSNAMSTENLNKIPLSGLPARAEKFHLGALNAHRGKTVDELLKQSTKFGTREF